MLEQLFTLWFGLFGSKWLKVGVLIKQATPPLLDLFLHFGAFPDNRHAISPRHLGLFLAKQQGVPRAGWRLEAREVQRQLAYRLIDETVPRTGRVLVRTYKTLRTAPPAHTGAHAACLPEPLKFDHSETPKAATEKAFDEAMYSMLAAVQARDIPEIQRACDRLKVLEEAAKALSSAMHTKDSLAGRLRG